MENSIQSVGRAFAILQYLATCEEAAPLSQISAACALPQATTHRFLLTLCSLGYVRNTGGGAYTLTLKLLGLCRKSVGSSTILSVCRPHLERLTALVNEILQIVIRDGNEVIYIEKIGTTSDSVEISTRVGHRVPVYRCASGRSILAALPEEEAERILKSCNRISTTKNTIVDLDSLKEQLRIIRKNGYALNLEEDEVGIRCVATALSNEQLTTNYAFSFSLPTLRLTRERTEFLANALIQARDNILSELTV